MAGSRRKKGPPSVESRRPVGQGEPQRVRQRAAEEVEPASRGPIGPEEVVGGPVPDERRGGSRVDSDAAGLPGADPDRVRKGGADGERA